MQNDSKIVRFRPRRRPLEPLLTDAERLALEGDFGGKASIGIEDIAGHVIGPPWDSDDTAGR